MTKLTADTITAADIQTLSIVVDRRGLDGMFAICVKASTGDRTARGYCAALINEIRTQRARKA